MRLLLVFLFVASSALAGDLMDGDKKLLLVQAVWRHGDRSPTGTYKSDPFQEPSWTFGGGGFGQLSPKGMAQHVVLGTKIRKMYIDTQYLQSYYNAHEVYVRSTDVNRTIISALSNLIGMYGQKGYNNRPGIDYPDIPEWPQTFIPVAVHTVADSTDFILNPDAPCDRHHQLWAMAKTSHELKTFKKNVAPLLSTLTTNCGQSMNIDNLWEPNDAFLIEGIHFGMDAVKSNVTWWTQELNDQINQVNDQVELYKNGVYNKTLIMNGLDIGLELQKIRGGSLTNDINMHMNIKLACQGKGTHECKWINNLKYYAYSAHDTTIYSFFSCLGIQSKAIKHGYPLYSAAVMVELWQDVKTNKNYFKMLYHADETVDFSVITSDLAGCAGDYCDIEVYQKFAARVQPDQPMNQWCLVNPNITTSSVASSTVKTNGATTPAPGSPSNDYSSSILSGFLTTLVALLFNDH